MICGSGVYCALSQVWLLTGSCLLWSCFDEMNTDYLNTEAEHTESVLTFVS